MSKKQLVLIIALVIILVLWFVFFPSMRKVIFPSAIFGIVTVAIYFFANRKK